MTDEIRVLRAKSSEYSNVLNKVKELAIKRDNINEERNNIPKADMERLGKVVPETFSAVSFANDINTRASRYGMSVRDFRENEAKTEVRDVIGLNQSQDKPYKTIMVSFRVIGQYSQFIRFLNDLETSLRLVDVKGLTIKAVDTRTSGNNSLEYLLDINTYSLR